MTTLSLPLYELYLTQPPPLSQSHCWRTVGKRPDNIRMSFIAGRVIVSLCACKFTPAEYGSLLQVKHRICVCVWGEGGTCLYVVADVRAHVCFSTALRLMSFTAEVMLWMLKLSVLYDKNSKAQCVKSHCTADWKSSCSLDQKNQKNHALCGTSLTLTVLHVFVQVQLLHGELCSAEEAPVQAQEASPVRTQGRQQLQRPAAQKTGGGLHRTQTRPGVSHAYADAHSHCVHTPLNLLTV